MSVSTRVEGRFDPLIGVMREACGVDAADVQVRRIPARSPRTRALAEPVPDPIAAALSERNIEALYTHQAEAVEALRAGEHTVIVTRTASGKSLCYQIPILESVLTDPDATALLLFPTKALAQDQLRSLRSFLDAAGGGDVLAGTYDGDTSGHTRRKLRDQGGLILTNPDMLHRGILPYHSRWFHFLERVKYVVIDELHAYRGIFGSHVAHVLRRLRRVFHHYGIRPTYVACSATIGNPGDLAERLIGEPVRVVDDDGSPAGTRTFVFWNPPYKGETQLERRSSNVEAERWLTALVKRGYPTIVFTKTRVTAELIYRYAADALAREGRGLADKIRPYRSGYLPKERRDIERRLFSGDLLGVVSTNALELGIDVGALDAAVLVGFPSTVASTLQRAGRAGRAGEESLTVILAYNEPIDQYLVRRPAETLDKTVEQAVVDLHNPYILAAQLACAAAELPLSDADGDFFGGMLPDIADALTEDGKLTKIQDAWYWSASEAPAAKVSLRNMSDDTYTIMDVSKESEVIGTVDEASALELLYPEAIYLHEGRTFYVRELDLEQKVAFVEPRQVDYYTQAIVDDRIRVEHVGERRLFGKETFHFGDVEVSWATVAFKKIQFYHLDAIGYHALDLPYQDLPTTAFWYAPSTDMAGRLKADGFSVRDALAGFRNVLGHLLPRYVMCDRQDLGTTLEASNVGLPTVYLYDRYPGGLGFAEKGFQRLPTVVRAGLDLVASCPCRTGCPSCVGVPSLDPGAHDDPEVRVRPGVPGKAATVCLMTHLIGFLPDDE